MRKCREVLRLVWACGLSRRQAASSCGIGRTTVWECLERAKHAGLDWAAVEALGEDELERRLYPPLAAVAVGQRPLPDWRRIHAELRRKGVTLRLLWEEYRAEHAEGTEGYRYSQFCELYRQWRGGVDLVMRQDHKAGETMYVDYAGQTMGVRRSGEVREAQVFVAVLGASNFTFAEATWSKQLDVRVASFRNRTRYVMPLRNARRPSRSGF